MRFAFLAAPILVLTASAAAAASAADVEAGKAIFQHTCHNCHSLEVGMNKVGPSLWHVVGRDTASIDGFMYSDALKSRHGTWTPAALDSYLKDPRHEINGVKMYFKGLPDPQDRADVIAFLESAE